jgi:hypothetical protein
MRFIMCLRQASANACDQGKDTRGWRLDCGPTFIADNVARTQLRGTMRFVLVLLPLTLGLLACADANMAADTDACERSASAAGQAKWQLVEPDVWSTGPVIIPRKKRPSGGSSSDPDGTNARGCIRREDNHSNPPQIHDLQKIGHARPTPAVARAQDPSAWKFQAKSASPKPEPRSMT